MDKNCVNREDGLRRWGKLLDRVEKKLDKILFLKDTALSQQPPHRVKVASTHSDESSDLELIPQNFFAENEDVESLDDVRF